MRKLLVIVSDRLTELIRKGEITPRYYNPGEFFDEVHILMMNDDCPDVSSLQNTVGRARLEMHSLPLPSFKSTLGWRPRLLRRWIDSGIRIGDKIRPHLIRVHGNFHQGFLAARMKEHLGIPMVASVHTHPDLDMRRTVPSWHFKKRLVNEILRYFERESLRSADSVIIVYESQRGYVMKNGARDVRLIYNVINSEALHKKRDFGLHNPPRILSVGRQFREKNPENIIRAMAHTYAVLTLIGDGAFHERLKRLACRLRVEDRIIFRKALPNDEICASLPEYDIFAVHCDNAGIPKAVMEPLLAGLPVVINRNPVMSVPEIEGDWVLSVENSEAGYTSAFKRLLGDQREREQLGSRALEFAREHFLPQEMEQKTVALYRELLLSRGE